jgi:hypothetical protein
MKSNRNHKNLFILISTLLTILAANTSQAKILSCDQSLGGPTPATAILDVESIQNNQYKVGMTLVNPAFPSGIKGVLVGTYNPDPSGPELKAQGKIGTIAAQIFLDPSSQGSSARLTVYAASRNIELGFGLHMLCK